MKQRQISKFEFELKAVLLTIVILFSIETANAQITPQSYPLIKANNIALEDTVDFILDIQSGADEKVVSNIDIGFSFTYAGVIFSKISISTGGSLGFGEQPIEIGSVLKNEFKAPSNRFLLAPLLSNFITSSEGYVGHFYKGSRGNGICVIEWKVRLPNSESRPYSRFQVLLYENENRIEYRYGDNIQPQESGVLVGLSEAKSFMTVITETAKPIYNDVFKNEFAEIPRQTCYRFYGTQPTLSNPFSDSLNTNFAQANTSISPTGQLPQTFQLLTSPTFKFENVIDLNPEIFSTKEPFIFGKVIDQIPFYQSLFFYFSASSNEFHTRSPFAMIHAPVPLSGLSAYYLPSYGLVSNSALQYYFWYDLSGNGNNASLEMNDLRFTNNAQPARLEGKQQNQPGQLIDFTESQFAYRAPSKVQFQAKSGLTFFSVVAPDLNFINSSSPIMGLSNFESTLDFGREEGSKLFKVEIFRSTFDGSESVKHVAPNFEFVSREISIVAFRQTASEKETTGEIFANGRLCLQEPSIDLSTSNYNNTYLARGNNSVFKGLLGDVLLYNRSLSDLELASVFFHLARVYDVWSQSGKNLQIDSLTGLFNYPEEDFNLMIQESKSENIGTINVEKLITIPVISRDIKGKAFANGNEIEPRKIYPDLAWNLSFDSKANYEVTFGLSIKIEMLKEVANPERLLIIAYDSTEKIWTPVNTIRSKGYLTAVGMRTPGLFAVADDSEPALTTSRNQRKVDQFLLDQNYPNPFNPSTTIRYQLASTENVSLKVYDVLGREVATLVNNRQSPGRYEVAFNASNISSGVYFYRLSTGSQSSVKKMLLVK
ncbi:MAG: T9SS type A sorting domain-containing protein [Chloroherpetonaceae bacterium]|nr:T9SS type A sorting domain-containing protein [Chloroherpetonaceae bacterium]